MCLKSRLRPSHPKKELGGKKTDEHSPGKTAVQEHGAAGPGDNAENREMIGESQKDVLPPWLNYCPGRIDKSLFVLDSKLPST